MEYLGRETIENEEFNDLFCVQDEAKKTIGIASKLVAAEAFMSYESNITVDKHKFEQFLAAKDDLEKKAKEVEKLYEQFTKAPGRITPYFEEGDDSSFEDEDDYN
jgi:hypothetical protein